MNNQANTKSNLAASSVLQEISEVLATWREKSKAQWLADFELAQKHGIRKHYDATDIQHAIDQCADELEPIFRHAQAEIEGLQKTRIEFDAKSDQIIPRSRTARQWRARAEAAEARAEAAEALNRELGKGIEAMDAKLTRYGDGEWVTAYVVPAGPWHHILGIVRGNPRQAVPVSMQSSEERLEMGPEWPVRDAGEGEQVLRCDPDNHTWRGNLPKYDARCVCGAVTWAERPR